MHRSKIQTRRLVSFCCILFFWVGLYHLIYRWGSGAVLTQFYWTPDQPIFFSEDIPRWCFLFPVVFSTFCVTPDLLERQQLSLGTTATISVAFLGGVLCALFKDLALLILFGIGFALGAMVTMVSDVYSVETRQQNVRFFSAYFLMLLSAHGLFFPVRAHAVDSFALGNLLVDTKLFLVSLFFFAIIGVACKRLSVPPSRDFSSR